MEFKQMLNEKQNMINDRLHSLIKTDDIPSILQQAMEYSVSAGGKRIRPILTLSIAEALNGNIDDALDFGCAIELIHTYSLIHDDLPAMDNDDFRRGKPTNHKVFGEAMAILAGDALLNFSFELLAEKIRNNNKMAYILAFNEIARASGARGMIAGQVIDITSKDKNITIDELYKMHSLKTGAMIEASCVVGCLISEDMDKIKQVSDYGKNLGIAFQIVDDILDCIGDQKKLGKTVGKDEKDNKPTYVTILGLESAKELARDYTKKALDLSMIIDKSGFLAHLTEYLLNRDN